MEQFEKVAAEWKADKRRWVKDATYAVYVQHISKHILPYFSKITSIGPDTLQGFVEELASEGQSPKTIRDIVVVARMIIRFGSRIGAWGPVELQVRFPAGQAPRRAPGVMSQGELRLLLGELRSNCSLRSLGVMISIETGLRIGEVVGLQWRDIDLRAGVIHVRKTVQRIYMPEGSFVSIGSPKTPTSLRDVPIPGEILKLLRPLSREYSPECYVLSGAPAPLEPRTYRDWFARLLARLGIPHQHFHCLRHTFATRCIESGCDYKTLSAILGHASISTTLDLYVHPGLAQKKRAIERAVKGLG